jgi:hypothetical protein
LGIPIAALLFELIIYLPHLFLTGDSSHSSKGSSDSGGDESSHSSKGSSDSSDD